ncbi:hydrolase [Ferrimonas balearica]|uniref:hydrolase n=1 Tax=Ferrimonas balearica TaxID=44012 RepID=UPI001C98F901|nr:hydrolase [Ferrimonas balearica]MBY5993924.1 hydrolase [Ferrimonas balearica]
MLTTNNAVLLLIDVQGKLARSMADSPALIEKLRALIQGVQHLDLPILWVEQYPQGLGPTVPELSELLGAQAPLTKLSFGCGGEPTILAALSALKRRQVLVCGIETHVCVYQSVVQLLSEGYQVEVVSDAVGSRQGADKAMALAKMARLGAELTSVEMCLFELMGRCDHPQFKRLLPLVK